MNKFTVETKAIYDINDRVTLLETQVKELQEALSLLIEAAKNA